MDIEKLIENAKVCCGDIETEDCSERCINPNDKRGNEVRWCRQWLIHDLHIALSAFQAENEQLRAEVERQRRSADDRQHLYENAERAYINVQAELEQVKRENLVLKEKINGMEKN